MLARGEDAAGLQGIPMIRFGLLVSLVGCTGEEPRTVEVADYKLQLQPVIAGNQDPFADLSRLDLVIEPASGEPLTYTLSSAEQGESPEVTGLPALEGATLTLEGYRDGAMVAFGRSEVVDLDTGEDSVQILVTDVNRFAWLSNLERDNFGAAAAPDGAGGFLLFGGTTSGFYSTTDRSTNAVLGVAVAPPTDSLIFYDAGTMPPLDNGDDGRIGHSATLLTGTHSRAGLILVAGGSTYGQGCEDSTFNAFLWDPVAEEAVASYELAHERFFHSAVEDQAGNVLLIGGLGHAAKGFISPEPTIEAYNPGLDRVETVSGTASGPLLFAAADSLGATGVLICGGVAFGSAGFLGSDACDLVSSSGEISEADALPMNLAHASLVGLGGGKALLTGGLDMGTAEVGFSTTLEATNAAWIYEGGVWREAREPMNEARAMHRGVLLPDGRVMLVGGVTEAAGPFPNSDTAMACAEIFDPETEKFAPVDTCDPEDETASLPSRVSLPAVAVDPSYGVLVVGGLKPDDEASNAATLFVGCPDEGKC